MTIDVDSLLVPISAEAPGGEEARSHEEYEAVAAELDKLTSLSGAGPVDWARVEQTGTAILSGQSKDFMIAAWVSAAWMERHGGDGLSAGLQLFAGLVQNFWETAFPPLKRLRGRRNALTWWLDRAQEWLEKNPLPPLPADKHKTMVEAVSAIDATLAEKDPESPPLMAFVRQIKSLEVEAEAAPVAADAPAAPAAASGASEAPSSGTAAPSAASAPAAPPRPAQTPSGGATPAFSAAAPNDINSLDDIVKALEPALNHIGHVARAFMAIDRFHPLMIDLGRFAARASLMAPPPANAGATHLMPPATPILDAFQSITAAGNPEGLVEFCESRIGAFPYWLDLDRESARGFGMLGEKGAAMRQRVVENALAFVDRMPGLIDLTFSDGTPFASEETRQWLESSRSKGGTGSNDPFDALRQQAQQATADGKADDAMRLYQSFMKASWSGRDRFRARLAMAEGFVANAGTADPMPLVQPLAEECLQRRIADWEPELAVQCWQLVYRAARAALANPSLNTVATRRDACEKAMADALGHIASLDFTLASRLA